MGIGDRIKQRRLDLGMSQQELADAMGYTSKSTINKIEVGKNDVSQSKVVKFANVLKTTPSFLMDWEDDEFYLGNYNNNIEYLSDKPELLELYKDIVANDRLVILFDKAKKLEPEELEQVLKIIDTFNKETKG